VRERGGAIAHLDVNLVCEAPKVGPHRDAMRARIAEIAGVTIDRVGVNVVSPAAFAKFKGLIFLDCKCG
jgi:2-C-methyl-D-erythritol 4-phosphate cytidylyltransferase / 2-C-methyl-D-erythritol 2,4-cyclodiphosphate synthase